MVRLVQGKPIRWYDDTMLVKVYCAFYIIAVVNDIFLQTGPDGASEEEWGVNYRALNNLFHISQSRESIFKYEVSVQMVEIYNEQVRDLLSNDGQKKYPLCRHFLPDTIV